MRFLLPFVLFLFCAAAPFRATAQDSPSIKIGFIVPLTGQFGYVGTEVERVMTLSEESEPLFSNVTPVYEDGQCGIGNGAATGVKKLIFIDNVDFLITGCSGETLVAGPVAEKNKVITFAVISNHKKVRDLGKYIFRTFTDAGREMKTLIAQIRKDNNLPLALLTEDNAYTHGFRELLEERLGSDIIFSEDFLSDELDFRSLIQKAKRRRPKAYYLNCAGPRSCAALLQQMDEANIQQQIYSYLYTEHPELLKIVGERAEGVRYLTQPSEYNDTPDFRRFLEHYRRRYKEEPSVPFLVRSTYDALHALANAVQSVGKESERIVEFLHNYQTQGALGQISFDKNGDVENVSYVMKEIRNGKGIPLQRP